MTSTGEKSTNQESNPAWAALVAPRAAHDPLAFEELARQYNFLNISAYARVLTHLLVEHLQRCGDSCRVLDIGCGRGLGREVGYQWAIRRVAGEFWGIEPDSSIQPPQGLFDQFQHSLMETATLPERSFDVVYSSMVMEHVADPDAFMNAVCRCLKPGGAYYFATPNAASFVPRLSQFLHQIGLDEFVLRLVKGRDGAAAYHYPLEMRMNTPRLVDACARRTGFRDPEYAYIEGRGSRAYFPGPLRPIYYLLVLKRTVVQNPKRLATMICRMTKS